MKTKTSIRILSTVAALAGAAGIAVAALGYTTIEIKSADAPQQVVGVSVVLPKIVEIQQALPAAATVSVCRVSGTVTNTLCLAYCTNGAARVASAAYYLVMGDYLYQTGTTGSPPHTVIICEE